MPGPSTTPFIADRGNRYSPRYLNLRGFRRKESGWIPSESPARGNAGIRAAGRWPKSEPLRAACLKHGYPSFFNARLPEHRAPEPDCTCGIHAGYSPWDVGLVQPRRPWSLVFGRVEGWGRVAVGKNGFRAEMARPLELFFEPWWDEPMWRAAARVARTYGIPLVSWETSLTEGAITS